MKDENEEEEDLLDKVGGVLTSVLREYKDQAMPLIDSLMPQIGQLLDSSRSAGERRVAICMLDDLLEHTSAGDPSCKHPPPPPLPVPTLPNPPRLHKVSIVLSASHSCDPCDSVVVSL